MSRLICVNRSSFSLGGRVPKFHMPAFAFCRAQERVPILVEYWLKKNSRNIVSLKKINKKMTLQVYNI